MREKEKEKTAKDGEKGTTVSPSLGAVDIRSIVETEDGPGSRRRRRRRTRLKGIMKKVIVKIGKRKIGRKERVEEVGGGGGDASYGGPGDTAVIDGKVEGREVTRATGTGTNTEAHTACTKINSDLSPSSGTDLNTPITAADPSTADTGATSTTKTLDTNEKTETHPTTVNEETTKHHHLLNPTATPITSLPYEILLEILLIVGTTNPLTLLLSQRTNKMFHAVIKSSLTLQNILYLQPTPPMYPYWLLRERKIFSTYAYPWPDDSVNPILETAIDRFTVHNGLEKRPHRRVWLDEDGWEGSSGCNCDCRKLHNVIPMEWVTSYSPVKVLRPEAVELWMRPEASWRRMQISRARMTRLDVLDCGWCMVEGCTNRKLRFGEVPIDMAELQK